MDTWKEWLTKDRKVVNKEPSKPIAWRECRYNDDFEMRTIRGGWRIAEWGVDYRGIILSNSEVQKNKSKVLKKEILKRLKYELDFWKRAVEDELDNIEKAKNDLKEAKKVFTKYKNLVNKVESKNKLHEIISLAELGNAKPNW